MECSAGKTSDLLIIEAGKSEKNYWLDLIKYRELFYFLAWRDILVRYKQTVIGVLWVLIRPFLTMVVFTVIFGNIAKLPSDGVPYPLLVFSAMLPWQFFSTSLTDSSNSIVANANMISKVYFPRIIVPASSIVVNLFDFAISFSILLSMMVFYQFIPSWKIITLPFFILLAVLAALGMGLWFTALNVKYRDFRFIIPFIVQFGLYISPVGFNSSVIPENWRLLYSLNPMVCVIDGFRWAILGQNISIHVPGFILSLVLLLMIFFTGIQYFRKTERTFADVI
ncbi:MAG: phosphate ABC transporter permease [Candidatus Melainabacteria bacterium RIFOXYA12_FULL_32_12]|nr:MAG: phosphate ABC transporter permease [Candidatus Melainabacteria bacterium RIFOXYA12_FULL_32_12]